MSHDTSLKQLIDSTNTESLSSLRGAASESSGNRIADISLKDDFRTQKVGTPFAHFADIPGALVYVGFDDAAVNSTYGNEIGQIYLKLNQPRETSGTYSHITVKLYNVDGDLLQTATGRHGKEVWFRGLDGGDLPGGSANIAGHCPTLPFTFYRLELSNTAGGATQTQTIRMYTYAHQQRLGLTNSYSQYSNSRVSHTIHTIPYIPTENYLKQGIPIGYGASITLTPIFEGNKLRFHNIQKISDHYTWSLTSGSDRCSLATTTTTGTDNIPMPAVTLSSTVNTINTVHKANVRLTYKDDFNTHATNYNTNIDIPLRLFGGDIPGMAFSSDAETYNVYHTNNDGKLYVAGVPGLNPITTNWKVSIHQGGAVVQQATKSTTWFFDSAVTFTNLPGGSDGSYALHVQDTDTGASRQTSVQIRFNEGYEAQWKHYLPPIHPPVIHAGK